MQNMSIKLLTASLKDGPLPLIKLY